VKSMKLVAETLYRINIFLLTGK